MLKYYCEWWTFTGTMISSVNKGLLKSRTYLSGKQYYFDSVFEECYPSGDDKAVKKSLLVHSRTFCLPTPWCVHRGKDKHSWLVHGLLQEILILIPMCDLKSLFQLVSFPCSWWKESFRFVSKVMTFSSYVSHRMLYLSTFVVLLWKWLLGLSEIFP